MTKSISEKISELRKARGLTQEKLGKLCGVSSQAVSKWEKAECLPDILLLPTLCEALGITADALLEVPATIREKNCMDDLFAYAKKKGEYRVAYQAICATSYIADKNNGGAKMSADGIKVHNTHGLGVVLPGGEMLQKVKETDISSIKTMAELVTNENVMSVVRILNFGAFLSEAEISDRAGLSQEDTETALFKLLKHGICECDTDGKYVFGAKSYVLFAILTGFYLSSADGYTDIGNLTCSYIANNN